MAKVLYPPAPKTAPEDNDWALCCCAAANNTGSARVVDAASLANLELDNERLPDMPLIEDHHETVCCFWTRSTSSSTLSISSSSDPATWPSTFTASVDCRPTQELGITLESYDETRCIIADIKPNGAVATWNSRCKPQQVVKKGDCLLGVNGHSGTSHEIASKLVSEKDKEPRLILLVKRGVVLNVNIVRRNPGQSVGLGLDRHDDDVLGIRITDVNENSLIGDYNDHNRHQVRESDRIVSVNGFTDLPEILRQLRKTDIIDLNMEILTWSSDTKGRTWVDLTRGCL